MKINTIRDAELKLCETLENLTQDKDSINYAREVANLAGKLIKYQSESMRHAEITGRTQTLPFMERGDENE